MCINYSMAKHFTVTSRVFSIEPVCIVKSFIESQGPESALYMNFSLDIVLIMVFWRL